MKTRAARSVAPIDDGWDLDDEPARSTFSARANSARACAQPKKSALSFVPAVAPAAKPSKPAAAVKSAGKAAPTAKKKTPPKARVSPAGKAAPTAKKKTPPKARVSPAAKAAPTTAKSAPAAKEAKAPARSRSLAPAKPLTSAPPAKQTPQAKPANTKAPANAAPKTRAPLKGLGPLRIVQGENGSAAVVPVQSQPPILRVVKADPEPRTAVGTLPPPIPSPARSTNAPAPRAKEPAAPLPAPTAAPLPAPTAACIQTGTFSDASSDGQSIDASWARHLGPSLQTLANGPLGSLAAEPDYFSEEERAAIAEQMAQAEASSNPAPVVAHPQDGDAYEALELSWFDEDIETALERSPDEFAPDESRAVAFFSRVFSRVRGK